MKNRFAAILNSKNGLRFAIFVAVLGALCTLTLRSAASTPMVAVNITNNSGWEIRALYLSPANSDDWGPDQLNGAVISPGGTYTLSYSWDQPSVKIIAEDKDGCFLSNTVDATSNSEWTISNNSPRNCGG
jgi:hypothetical protein